MTPFTFILRAEPEQRLDLSPLNGQNLADKSLRDIEAIELQTTRLVARVGDIFRLVDGDRQSLYFDGGSGRFDRVGGAMAQGLIVVDGDVGVEAGLGMTAGRLSVRGNAGDFAASQLSGGVVEIHGDAGARLGGAPSGQTNGMSGGLVHVRGNVGERAGDRLRRGTILVEGRAGAYAGSRMIAGTLAIGGLIGDLPGYLMNRGTIFLAQTPARLSPTFLDCGAHDLVAARLLAAYVSPISAAIGARLRRPLRRYAGDSAALGKGEILIAL